MFLDISLRDKSLSVFMTYSYHLTKDYLQITQT